MINEKEIELSNRSYIYRDFYQIYPELLDSIVKYTERWDPKSSNETDPGVVLTKLAAMIGDKNNYNIDKNILENFITSCTQEDSMRKLCDMMGYNMKYYQSASTYITFKYYGQVIDNSTVDKLENNTLKLPAFSTVVTDEAGNISYVLLEEATITKDNNTARVLAMQGKLSELQLNSDTTIRLNNIDDNNRVYLPLSTIAENGIFIWSKNDSKTYNNCWRKVNNLNVERASDDNKVWKFGFDSSKSLPYIEFPNNISELIGDGLNISYLTTLGVNGNIGAKKLCKLTTTSLEVTSEISIDLSGDDSSSVLYIFNDSASINGADKETLNQAYNNFKKTVGTFDTLVTCRDYANAIYNMTEEDGVTPYVGNIQTSDIRDDLNYSNNIITYGDYGVTHKTEVKINSSTSEPLISHFDVVLYPFGRIINSYSIDNYQGTFKYSSEKLSDIYADLENNKTISHSFKIPKDTDLFCIKQLYDLKAKITTTSKVSSAEEVKILSNIATSLYKNFNSREIDFGEAIPFDLIYEVIKSADTRIKNVSLDEPEINTYVMQRDGSTFPIKDTTSSTSATARGHYLNLLTGNILSGHLPLFKYFKDLEFSYGQKKLSDYDVIYKPIKTITPKLELHNNEELGESKQIKNYTLKKNEAVQFIAPSLSTDVTYPYTVNYFAVIDRGSSATKHRYEIVANEEYQLKSDEKLYINYTSGSDDDSKVIIDILYTNDKIITYKTVGTSTTTTIENVDFNIIKPNFILEDSNTRHGTGIHNYSKTSGSYFIDLGPTKVIDGMYQLGSSEQIEHRNYVKTILKDTKKCYWITSDGKLTFDTNNEKILKDGEYFIYRGMSEDDGMFIFGSGTKLIDNTVSGGASLFDNIEIDYSKQPSLEDINLYGLAAGINWEVIRFISSRTFTIQEMQFITLTEGDTINSLVLANPETSYPLDYNSKEVSSASYTLDGDNKELPNTSITGFSWKAFTRLDLVMSPSSLQTLVNTADSTTSPVYSGQGLQSITIEYYTGATTTSTKEIKGTAVESTQPSILCNYTIQKAGIGAIPVTGVSDMSFGVFNSSIINDVDSTELSLNEEYNILRLNKLYKPAAGSTPETYAKIPVIVPTNTFALCTVYCKPTGSNTVTIYAENSAGSEVSVLSTYNSSASPTPSTHIILTSGVNVIKIATSCNIYFKATDVSGNIVIKKLDIINSANSGVDIDLLAITSSEVPTILTKLRDYNGKFLYNNTPDSEILIDTDNMSDENVWYDYNNVYNKFVISEINSDTLSAGIELTKSSRL